LAVVLTVAGRVPAHAGEYADALSQCLVDRTSDQDKSNLVRWIFASAAQNPDVSDIAKITQDQRSQMNKEVAGLFERLLTKDCKSEFRDVKENEGSDHPLATGFAMLISVAMKGLIDDPSVSKALGSIDSDLHRDKINEVLQGTDGDEGQPPRPDQEAQPGPPPPDSGGLLDDSQPQEPSLDSEPDLTVDNQDDPPDSGPVTGE
jgi:hypothetical protein